MSTVHDLKTLTPYYNAVVRGEKTFEIRRDDRGFQKGDTVRLKEWLPEGKPDPQYSYDKLPQFSGRELTRRISWILTGGQFGLEPGYVILALAPSDALDTAGAA